MSFKKLLSAIESGDTNEAKKFASSLETDFNSNIAEIEKLESKASEAISGRDKVKQKMRDLASKLGVDELTADVLDELRAKKSTDSEIEAKYKKELDKLAKQIEENETSFNSKQVESDSRYQDAIIDKELLKLGAVANVAEGAIDDVVRYLKNNAIIKDGNIVYLKDGVAERNDKGRPINISEKIEGLKASKAYLFKANGQGGSGEPHQGGASNHSKKRSEMSHSEKGAFISEKGEEAYFKLPN